MGLFVCCVVREVGYNVVKRCDNWSKRLFLALLEVQSSE